MLELLISISAASFNSVILHIIPKKRSVFTLNLIGSAVWLILLLTFNAGSVTLNTGTILWGLIYGIIQLIFLIFKARAMNSGPVSLTTLIGNCSLILSTFVSVVVWNESISIVQIICIASLITAFFLCTYTNKKESSSKKWVFNCVFFFVFAALVGIVFKAFSKSSASGNSQDMMIVAAFVMFIFLLSKQLLSAYFGKSRFKFDINEKENRIYLLCAVACGVLSCVYNRLNITAAGILPGAVFYPCFNGGVILLSSLLGILILREKLNARQALGIVIGLISVIIIGIL